jgi:hypothetical protein
MMTIQMGDMPKDLDEGMKKQMTEMMNKAKAAIVKSCQDTKWSGEALGCIKSAKTGEEAKKCDEKLTKDQKDAAEKAAKDSVGMGGGPAMKKEEAPMPEGGGAEGGGAAAGSAEAGSAAAGSAAAGSAAGSAEAPK